MHEFDLDFHLDIFGQQPGIQIYTQICFCFPVPTDASHSVIINTLTNGLEKLSASFPWVAGQVVKEGTSEGNSGVYKIKPLERIPRLIVKDLRDDRSMPSMDVMRQANFPMSMLDENIIAPRNTIPGTSSESPSNETPVFLIQATFITGGLLLTFIAGHQVMDMTGQGQIIRLLAKACRDEEFTSEELSWGNRPRHDIIPLLDDSYEPGSEIAHQIAKPTVSDSTDTPAPAPPPKCNWACFSFDPTSLAALKSLATKTVPSGYVSTDDTLTAFVWQSVVRARLPRLTPTSKSTFARAIDPRRYLDIPPTYPGLVQNMTYHTYTLQKLIEEPLGVIASQFRSAVDPKTSNLGYKTRALATFLNRSPEKNNISVTANIDTSSDIMLSSWAKENFYELDFDIGLGKPEALRRPRFIPFESLMYIMPRRTDGELVIAVCLRVEDAYVNRTVQVMQ